MSEGYKIYQIKNFIKKIENKELNTENFRKIAQELAAVSTMYRDHNLLIDIREIIPLKNFREVLKIVLEAGRYQYAFRNRIAVVIANEPGRIERTKFFKVCLKPGKYKFEYFTDYEKAIDWLSDIQDPSETLYRTTG